MSTTLPRSTAIGAAVAALALVLAITVGPTPADAGTKIIKKTFSSSQPILIPATGTSGAAAPYPSERNVSGFNQGVTLDVNLTLKNLSHTFPDDIDIMLSHRGKTRKVMSDVGGGGDVNNITIRLDDEAANQLPDNGPLVAGSFRPRNVGGSDPFAAPAPTPVSSPDLVGFDGSNPNGPWRLWVMDDAGGDSGQLAGGWSITIRARVST
jgi:hypothetical protein